MLLCQLGAGASAAAQGRRGVARPPPHLLHIAHGLGMAAAHGTPRKRLGAHPCCTVICVTGTLPIPGGGRGLWAPELATVSPFTHSIK